MTIPVSEAGSAKLVGGRVSLDFLNSGELYAVKGPVEYLTDYNELVIWGGHVGILREGGVELLRREREYRSVVGGRVNKTAWMLR